jgi:uncharacterized protein (TIGR02145 family)
MQLPHLYPNLKALRALFTMAILLLVSSYSRGQFYYYITDTRDGQNYQVVHIDDLWWMAENLNIGTRIDIPQQQKNNDIIEKYCYLNDDANCNIYGGLYQWDELMQYGNVEFYQGICPSGWHVSTDEDWKQLEAFLGMKQSSIDSIGNYRGFDEGGKLKIRGTEFWYSPNELATNSVGFSALPAGTRDTAGIISWLYKGAWFWNAETYGGKPLFRSLWYNNGNIAKSTDDKRFGASARCIKDSPFMFGRGSFTDTRDGREYATVKIENHWWMAENLNVGEQILHNVSPTNFGSIEKYCYNDMEANCDTFGGLYQWDEAMNYDKENKQGICPDGWHIPTDEDWMELEWASGMYEEELDYLGWRGNRGIFFQPESAFGFDALFGGSVFPNGTSNKIGTEAYFWTSSEGDNDQVSWARSLKKGESGIYRNRNYYRQNSQSLRCVCNDNEIISLSIEAEDTVCAGQETLLKAKTSGGTISKYYYWWSNTSDYLSMDSILNVVSEVNTTTYYVRIIDGYTYIRDSVTITVEPAPSDFNITGDTSVCPTDDQLEYSVTDNPSYQYSSWNVPEGIGTLVSSDENHAGVSWGTTPGYGYIEVTATDVETGCSAQKSLRVEVMPAPKPEIILKGQSLLICTDSGMFYRWYHNGDAVKDATRQFYYAKNKESGSYTVEITWDNQCLKNSDPINFTEKSTVDPGENESQTVFIRPNPTDGNITLDMINDYTGPVEIRMISSSGRLVKQYQINKYNAIYSTGLDLGKLEEGSYLMTVAFGTETEVHRITIK